METENTKTVIDVIKHRRSIRRYKKDALPKETVEQLLDAARYAPTALGKQTCHFLVATDAAVLKEVAAILQGRLEFGLRWRPILKWFVKSLRDPKVARIGERLREEKRNIIFYDAPCVVFFATRKDESYGEADCLLAAQNLMIAAEAMGIGSVMLGTALMANKLPQVRAFLKMPSDFQIRCVVALGYSDEPVRELPERAENMLGWVE